MLAVWRDVPDAVVPVAAADIDGLGNVCCRAVGHGRNVCWLGDVCRCRWRDICLRAVVDRCFVCDASRAVDAKRRYGKKHFSRVVHDAPAFLFTRCEGISLPISDRKRFLATLYQNAGMMSVLPFCHENEIIFDLCE